MAYTRIHAIKSTLGKSIAYICNPNKTDGQIFVSSFGCSAETAAIEFEFANGKNLPEGANLAHHLIQSFAPGEVTFDQAHKIGIQLADKLLAGKHSYVIATHIEKNHVHNHIIFCATENESHRKYNSCRRSYYKIRKLSDELCSDQGLSVIVPGKKWRDKDALIDTEAPKFKDSPSLKNWAEAENLKRTAAAYAMSTSVADIHAQIDAEKTHASAARSNLVSLEKQIKSSAEILKYAMQYEANKPYHIRSRKSKDSDRYFREHETQLLLYDGAKNVLRHAGINLKTLDTSQLTAELKELQKQKVALQKSYRGADNRIQELQASLNKVQQYLGQTKPLETGRQTSKNTPSL